jgi:hypothetical protein
MLKKITAISTLTVLAIAMGTAQAAPVELTSSQMDNVNAGSNWLTTYGSLASATSTALALGQFSATSTSTITLASHGMSASQSSAAAIASGSACGVCW